MLITKEVKKIDSMSGRGLDHALAEALELKCPEGCHKSDSPRRLAYRYHHRPWSGPSSISCSAG